MENEKFYSVEKVAEETGFTDNYIRKRIGDGALKAYKTGRRWFVLHSDLITFIKSGNDAPETKAKQKKPTER